MKSSEEMVALAREAFGDCAAEIRQEIGWALVYVPVERWFDACAIAREKLGMDYLASLTAVDRKLPDPPKPADAGEGWAPPPPTYEMELAAHLYSISGDAKIALKCKLNRENPVVRSVTEHWNAANWHERETAELFGIVFTGHPQLEPLLLPEDWEGHPLRKDYVQPD